MPAGVIQKGIGGFYYVRSGDMLYECTARGIFRKDGIAPLPGDNVEISIGDADRMTGCIEEIRERKTELVRPAVANVDQIAVVTSVRSPEPDLALLDKLLVMSGMKGVDAMICINKTDLDSGGIIARKLAGQYENASYPVLLLSSKTDTGFDALHGMLAGRTTVFAGQSGVGKSTILNRITKSWAMATGDISKRIERGRHTTRHAELLWLRDGGGYVVDTPGFSSFEIEDMPAGELECHYPEFAGCIGKCRFKGCSHVSEPECAVKKAVESGSVCMERYERYAELYGLLKARNKRQSH